MRWQSFELLSRFSMSTLICTKDYHCFTVFRLGFTCHDHDTGGFM